MRSEWSERKRVHRRGLTLGIGISAGVHAAVFAWTAFSVPATEAVDQRSAPDWADAGTAFEVVRLAEALEVSAAPDVNDVDGAAGAPATPADAREVSAEGPAVDGEADLEVETASTPTDPELRARPVTTDRRTRDFRAQLEPPSLAIEIPVTTNTSASPAAPARTASVMPGEKSRESGSDLEEEDPREGGSGETTPESDVASDGEGAVDDQEGEGGWGLGDLFRGISVAISGGGICPPGLVNGRPAPAVTSVNDRNPYGSPGSIGSGGAIGMPGPSGTTDPMGSIGRIGGGSGPVGRMAGIGGIHR